MFIPSATPRNCGADLYLRSKETELERECLYKNLGPSTEEQTLLYVPCEEFPRVSLISYSSCLCIYFIFPLLPYPVAHLTPLRSCIKLLSYSLILICFLLSLNVFVYVYFVLFVELSTCRSWISFLRPFLFTNLFNFPTLVHLVYLTFWLRDASTSLTFNNCTLWPHCIYVLCKQRLVPLTA
jgi:hypothetical protein